MWSNERWKVARRCGAKRISKSKCPKHLTLGAFLEVEMSKKCTRLWCEAHFEGKMYKTPHVRTTFWRSDAVLRVRHKGLCTLSKVSKTWGYCGIFKNDGRRGTFEEDPQRFISRGRRSMFIRDVKRSGRWVPERGCILEHQIFRFAKMIRWFCVTGAALRMTWPHFFVAGAILQTDGLEKSQNALARGQQLCAQLCIFEGRLVELPRFWCRQLRKMRKLCRIFSFLTLSSSKSKELSQNCCIFDVVNEVQKLRKSCRIVSFSSLQIDMSIDRQLQLQLQVPLHYTTTTTDTNILHYIAQH